MAKAAGDPVSKYLLSFTCAALLAGGCSDTSPDQQEVASVPTIHSLPESQINAAVTQSAWSRLPARARLPGVASVGLESSWAERIAKLTEAERESVQAANTRYNGALQYASVEERDALVHMGFPTVEEWLVAEGMTDAKLATAAEGGNVKAQALLADRLATRLSRLPATAARPEDQKDLEREAMRVGSAATGMADAALGRSKSPFAAYVVGYQRSVHYRSQEPMIAAALIARSLGDNRAAQVVRRTGVQQVNSADLLAMYNSMLVTLGK